jgi:hypothetical protein
MGVHPARRGDVAVAAIAGLGLQGIEINSGWFLPPAHIPNIDDTLIQTGHQARLAGTGRILRGREQLDQYLGGRAPLHICPAGMSPFLEGAWCCSSFCREDGRRTLVMRPLRGDP